MQIHPINPDHQHNDSEQSRSRFDEPKRRNVIDVFRDGDELRFRNMTNRYIGVLGLVKLTSKCLMQLPFLWAGIFIGSLFLWFCIRGGCRGFHEINDLFAR